MFELAGLGREGGVQLRMRMAVNVDPPRRDPVEEPTAVLGEQIDAVTP
jgi:hypothetical protein